MRNVKRRFVGILLPLCAASIVICGCAHNSSVSARRNEAVIRNNTDWLDTDGKPIMAHDGGISRFANKFYWYGTSYKGNPKGRWGLRGSKLQNGFNVYGSRNLVDWK
ncbi:MAG: hypothetical protein ACYTEX_15810 [Planctomycetota bacterium]